MDVAHFYDAPVNADLDGPDAVTRYNQTIAGLQARAARDMLGEGFTENEIAFEAEAVIEAGAERRTVPAPVEAQSLDELRDGVASSDLKLRSVTLRAACATPRVAIERRKLGGRSPKAALKGEREFYRNGAFTPSKVYAAERLKRGTSSRVPRSSRRPTPRRRAPGLDLHHRRLRQWRAGAGVVKVRITEYLDIDLERELWICNRCDRELGPARENYKEFMLVYQRDPKTVHHPHLDPKEHRYTMSSDKEWVGILEFYCPGCAAMSRSNTCHRAIRSRGTSSSTSTR